LATLNAGTFESREAAEQHYLALVDSWAASQRKIDAMQQAIYQRKIEEAQQGSGSLIQMEADAKGVDVAVVAADVLIQKAAGEDHAHAIEIKRVVAKKDVRNAATAADMHRIFKTFKESL
tara:strand:+ start:718 stop:1077 length:360 start_codon:yes stop_codon:yes gene_type:complete